ncbi:MAG: DUF3261 domain-containing protein [Proteobacteria bacterium]|nr:DUF3261 domain-containing protein [Pseudomonadota bacterium]
MPRRASLALALFLAASCGCQTWLSPRPPCPGPLAPVAALAEGEGRRFRVRFGAETPGVRLDAVLRRQGDELVLAAFTPFGTRAFAVVQRGGQVETQAGISRHLGVAPVWLLDAVHRAWLLDPARDVDGEEVVVGSDGSRHYRRPPRADAVTVAPVAEGVRVSNPWCGYDASLRLVESARSRRAAS